MAGESLTPCMKGGNVGLSKKPGFYWHLSSDTLMGWCYNYKGWVECIKDNEPAYKVEGRLRLFRPVKGKLPEEFLEAFQGIEEADEMYDETARKIDEALQELEEGRKRCRKAEERFQVAVKIYKEEIEALHKRECPNCSWAGRRIISGDGGD